MAHALSSSRAARRARAARVAGVLLAVAAVAVLHAESIRVQPLARGGRVLVSFELAEAIPEEVLAAIHSGLETSFVYEVDLRRGTPLWFDRTVDQAVVTASVQYDNLRRSFRWSRVVNGRTEDSKVVENEAEMRDALTKFEKMPLFSTSGLEANAEYYVRVRARTHPRNSVFLWPWSGGTGVSGFAKFTFIPGS